MQNTLPAHVFPAVPTFFRACCHDVKYRVVNCGYEHPGYHLSMHLRELEPYTIDSDEWESRVETLLGHIGAQDDDAVLGWFLEHFPRCMEYVPKRRRQAFVKGVYQAAENDCI